MGEKTEERRVTTECCLEVVELARRFFSSEGEEVRAVDRVTFSINSGETFGLVGESGCGKTTLAHILARLLQPDSGSVILNGLDWLALEGKVLRRERRRVQLIFQDPVSSLNPRFTAGEAAAEPLRIQGLRDKVERAEKARGLLAKVGLADEVFTKLPEELSGGQKQRIAIARALALEPELLIADEPVSSLDGTAQEEIMDLMGQMCDEFRLTTLFITHNLSLVRRFCSRVAVMFRGRLVEVGQTEELFEEAAHPYTRILLGGHGEEWAGFEKSSEGQNWRQLSSSHRVAT